MAKKKEAPEEAPKAAAPKGRVGVVAVAEDGAVVLVHGHGVPGEEEHGFEEGARWVIDIEAALELAAALPNVVQAARTQASHVG